MGANTMKATVGHVLKCKKEKTTDDKHDVSRQSDLPRNVNTMFFKYPLQPPRQELLSCLLL